jgi:histidinol-phosphate aminotransferase
MNLNRRDLLSASALLLAGPAALLRAGASTADAVPAHAPPSVLCWNENPYGPSPAARAALTRTIPEGCRYPDDDEIDALNALIARREGVGLDYIVSGTGSGELLRALGLLYGRDGGEIIAAAPTYTELTHYAERRGALVKFIPVDAQLRHDLPAMRAAVSARTRAVYLCNPNNPTGTALPAADLRNFVRGLPDGVTAIVDEAYMDFTTAPGVESVVDLVWTDERPRLVVLRTFSKIHGMAGVRYGYAVTRPDIAAELEGACMTTPNIFAVRAARASLGDTEFLADCRRRILASRARVTQELARRGLRYAEPQGNFVFFDTGMPHERFTALMQARNILVGRRFAPYDSWCRVSIGTEPEIDAFLRTLGDVTARA